MRRTSDALQPLHQPSRKRLSALLYDKATPKTSFAKDHTRTQSESATVNLIRQTHNRMGSLQIPPVSHGSELPLRLERREKKELNPPGELRTQIEKTVQRPSGVPFDKDRLQHQLVMAQITEPINNREFLPSGDMDRLVTQSSVDKELSRIEYLPRKILFRTRRPATYVRIGSTQEIDSLQHVRLGTEPKDTAWHEQACYKRIFTILLLMGRARKIWSFVKEGVSDADLPLSKARRGDSTFELRRRRGSDQTPLKCLKRQSDISNFATGQWGVLVPCFGKSDMEKAHHYKMQKGEILPLTSWKNIGRVGGFGEVHQGQIHPEHHEFSSKEVSSLHPPCCGWILIFYRYMVTSLRSKSSQSVAARFSTAS